MFVLNSSFNNTTSAVVATHNNQGSIASLEEFGGSVNDIQIYWRNSDFKQWDAVDRLAVLYATGYFDNVADSQTGLTSEDTVSVAFTATAGQTESALTQTALMRQPADSSYVTVTAQPGKVCPVTGWDFWYNPYGTDLQVGYDVLTEYARPAPKVRLLFDSLSEGQEVGCEVAMAVRPWPAGVEVPDTSEW